jgi:hypothetical protein
MTKLTHTLNRLFTAGAVVALSVGLAVPAQAMAPDELAALKQSTAQLASRTETPGFVTSASDEPGAIQSGIMSLELDLQFPGIGLAATASTADYSSYTLVRQAITTRNTMVLRACTIAEQAAPPANLRMLSYANLAERVNSIQSALLLHAPMHRPNRSEMSYATVEQMNAEVEDIMAMLGDYAQLDPSVDMSTWYWNQLLTIMWQNAKDACALYDS